jgi:hypothetical protein
MVLELLGAETLVPDGTLPIIDFSEVGMVYSTFSGLKNEDTLTLFLIASVRTAWYDKLSCVMAGPDFSVTNVLPLRIENTLVPEYLARRRNAMRARSTWAIGALEATSANSRRLIPDVEVKHCKLLILSGL